jgi:hypothetical protein
MWGKYFPFNFFQTFNNTYFDCKMKYVFLKKKKNSEGKYFPSLQKKKTFFFVLVYVFVYDE